jgi:hypothetical protein
LPPFLIIQRCERLDKITIASGPRRIRNPKFDQTSQSTIIYLSRRLVSPELHAKAEASAKADQLSTLFELLNHFLKLRAEHIHLSAHQIAAQRDACHAKVAREGAMKAGEANSAFRLR